MTTTDYRLAPTLVPNQYNIFLHASPRRRTFSGNVEIVAHLTQARDVLTLHARGLRVKDAWVTAGKKRLRARSRLDTEHETVELRLGATVRGNIRIACAFSGSLGSGMHGLYLAQDGAERAIVSQCEATDARAIFPCLDEPAFKAKLAWKVQTDMGLCVITNGVPRGRQSVHTKKEEVHSFAPTRPVSTYLAAITIGNFAVSRAQSVLGVPCRVAAGPNKLEQTHFAQQVTAFVLPYYTNYFGKPYNYQKLDQVAVPGFDAGAMENVGAIFYRQSLLLMQQDAVSWAGQKRIAEVIAHEIAHQWFGNLVTMQWWDDLWLNEAFATWIAYKVCDVWRPDWRMWDDFFVSKMEAMQADALASTHPIYTEVKSPAQATELFDVITYEKGCGVLRMVENFMGAKAFQAAIAAYMDAYQNGNARGQDLWNKLSAQVAEPVDTMMQAWVSRPGHPLVTCKVRRDGGQTTLLLQQQRFFSDPKRFDAAAQAQDEIWPVPLVLQYGSGGQVHEQRVYFDARQATVTLDRANVDWLYPNAAATGFFRVCLDADALQGLLRKGLSYLSPSARCALLDDQWAQVCCGKLHVDAFLDTLQALKGDRDHAVARAIVGRLFALRSRLLPEGHEARFATFVRGYLAPHLQELGAQPKAGESAPQAVRRASILGALGDLGRDPQVLQAARDFTRHEAHNPLTADANLAGVMISLHALSGDKKRLQSYVRIFQHRKAQGLPPQVQGRHLSGLGSFENKNAVAHALQLCVDGTIPQDQLRLVLVPFVQHRTTQIQAWRFLQKHWATIAPRVGGMGIARLVESLGALPLAQKAELQRFFQTHPVAEAERAVQKAIEAMQLRHDLQAREAAGLVNWLSKQ